MNSIVILCGGNSCGKTTTLKGFFKVKSAHSPKSYVERKLDGKRVCAVSFGSPQEQEPFCKVELVNGNIRNRISECKQNTNGEPYILVIPFTMSVSKADRTKLNKDCILKPIKELQKMFKVFVIYLRKTNTRSLAKKDALMEQVALKTIETTKDDYDKSAELEKYVREAVIKSH
jgi:ABC-type cobalamin/Fe3+-siderophores transport system ATPase subunit